MSEKIDTNVVEVLDNGDVMFEGRLVSPAELIVGTVLCDLKKTDEIDSDIKEQLSEDAIAEETRRATNLLASSSSSSSKKRKFLVNSISLPEDDVRLSYAKTFFDAVNSADESVVLKMLRDIATSNLVMVNRKLTPDPEFILPQHFEIFGPEAIAAACAQFGIASPDVASTVLDHSIHIYENGESLIECDVVCNLTQIYELEGFPEGFDEKLIVKSVVDEMGDKLDSVQLTSKIVSHVESKNGKSISVPITIGAAKEEKGHILRSKTSMHLNSNHKVFLIIIAYE